MKCFKLKLIVVLVLFSSLSGYADTIDIGNHFFDLDKVKVVEIKKENSYSSKVYHGLSLDWHFTIVGENQVTFFSKDIILNCHTQEYSMKKFGVSTYDLKSHKLLDEKILDFSDRKEAWQSFDIYSDEKKLCDLMFKAGILK